MPENSIQDAINDAIAVYRYSCRVLLIYFNTNMLYTRYLIKIERVNPDQLAVYGCSAGGVMTLLTTIAAKQEGYPMPAAIAPWAVSTKTKKQNKIMGSSYLNVFL